MTMEISNRLPDLDTVEWQAVLMLDGDEVTLSLDLAPWLDVSEVQEAFIDEANDKYWLTSYPLILSLKSALGTFS